MVNAGSPRQVSGAVPVVLPCRGRADPRRACAEALVAALRGVEAILVYNAAFEGGRLLKLAAELPDLAGELHAAADRIFDLLPVVRRTWYHRDLRG